MIRNAKFKLFIWKFLQMSKLLCNVLKISGGQMPQMPLPWLRACVHPCIHGSRCFKTTWCSWAEWSCVIARWSSTGCHCIFKTLHRCFVNIYGYGFESPARNGDLKSVHFVHIVTAICSWRFVFLLKLFWFNNTNTSVRSFIFSLLTTVLYI